MTTATANREQIEYWNSDAAQRWLEMQTELDRIVQPFGDAAINAAQVEEGQRILDVGCGCGGTTLALAELSGQSGKIDGADISHSMLQQAEKRASEAGLSQVKFHQADAQTHTFPSAYYDRIFSRFGVMFFDDPAAAFSNLAHSLRPGGRISFVCWQPPGENPWIMKPLQAVNEHITPPEPPPPGAPGPFSLADPINVESLLSSAGFTNIAQKIVQRQIKLGSDPVEATRFAIKVGPASARFSDASAEAVATATEAIQRLMDAHQTDDGVMLAASARVVTATRA